MTTAASGVPRVSAGSTYPARFAAIRAKSGSFTRAARRVHSVHPERVIGRLVGIHRRLADALLELLAEPVLLALLLGDDLPEEVLVGTLADLLVERVRGGRRAFDDDRLPVDLEA